MLDYSKALAAKLNARNIIVKHESDITIKDTEELLIKGFAEALALKAVLRVDVRHIKLPDKDWVAKMNENFTITVSLGNELMRLESIQYNLMQDFHKSLNTIDDLLDNKIQPLIRKKNQQLLGQANRSGNLIINFMMIALV